MRQYSWIMRTSRRRRVISMRCDIQSRSRAVQGLVLRWGGRSGSIVWCKLGRERACESVQESVIRVGAVELLKIWFFVLVSPLHCCLSIQRNGQIFKQVSRLGLLRSPNVGLRYLLEQTREERSKSLRVPHKSFTAGTLRPTIPLVPPDSPWETSLSCLKPLQSNSTCWAVSSWRPHFLHDGATL